MELVSSSPMSSSTTRSILNRLDQLLSDEATSSDITTPLSTFQESSVPGSHWSASFFRIRICVKDPASVLLNISPLNWTADFKKNVINCLLNLFVWNSVFQIWIRPDPQLFGLQYLPGFGSEILRYWTGSVLLSKTGGNMSEKIKNLRWLFASFSSKKIFDNHKNC